MRPRLLLIYLHDSSFVLDDRELLSSRYDVRTFRLTGGSAGSSIERAAGLVLSFVRQLGWLLVELPRARVVLGWFADYHMVLPVLLAGLWRRPCVVVLGGYDANRLAEFGYGVFQSRWRAPWRGWWCAGRVTCWR